MYAVLAINSSSTRSLFTLDPETGHATLIGSFAFPFAAITFDDSGTLYGVTGSNNSISSDNRNALFTIDTGDAGLTRHCRFTAANQGHALAFGGGLLYHASQAGTDWSGNLVLESVDPAGFPVTSTDPCPTTNIPVTQDSAGVPIHPMSMLVTDTGMPTATLLLSGWNAVPCCDAELFSIAVDGGSATAELLGKPESYFKGLAFHAFEPIFASLSDVSITKFSARAKEGKERRVIFTIDVTNSGASPTSGLLLTDDLDTSKLAYVSDDSGCDLQSGFRVTCDLGSIAAFSTRTVTIETMVACKGKNCASVSNTARVNIPLDQWVADPSNSELSSSISTSLKGKY
ncbi:MAG: hypothetical protein ABR538_08460, partial [Candidatus Binatia bacterium]